MVRSRPLAVGNWKMNGTGADLAEIEAVRDGIAGIEGVGVAICPPATLIGRASAIAAGSALAIGGQDCHAKSAGAHTGDISAEMLADAGAAMVIVGHSERRTDHSEGDPIVRAKAEAVLRAGLVAILCVGESRAERDAGETFNVLGRQLAGSVPDASNSDVLVIAYEPVWAIGTGLTPTGDDIAAAHAHIRSVLVDRFGDEARSIGILYGGSVKPDNAASIGAIEGVDGALVGGASLKAVDFLGIVAAMSG